MANKKKRKSQRKPGGQATRESRTPPLAAAPMDAEEIRAKALAVNRLKGALHAMSEPPEPIMALFERLGIPVTEIELSDGATVEKYTNTWTVKGLEDGISPAPVVRLGFGRYFVIKVDDLFEGEEANQAQGSIVKRLYGEQAEAEMMSRKATGEPGSPGSKSNPLEPDQVLKANPLTHLSPSEQAQFRDLLARGVAAREAQMRRNTIIDPNDLLGGQQ